MRLAFCDGAPGRVECKLLDKPVGFKCLATLLGVGHSRVRKSTSGAPDLRHGQRAYQSRPGSWTVDGFLQVAYDSIAETLPDQSLNFSKLLSEFSQKSITSRWGALEKVLR